MAAAKPKLQGRNKAWTRRRENPDTREQLLRAAAVAFAKEGYEGVSIASIAREVGITAPSVYNHFGSKNELLFTYLDGYAELVMSRCAEAVDAAGSEPSARLRSLVEAHVRTDLQHLDTVPLVNTFFQHGTGAARVLTGVQHEALMARQRWLVDLLRAIVEDGCQAGAFKVDNVTTATFSVLGSVSNAVYWFRAGGKLGVDDVARQLADLALASLASAARR